MNLEYRQLVVNMRPPRGTRPARKLRFRETQDTMIFGGLSTAIGVGLLVLLALAVAGREIDGWIERAVNTPALYYVPVQRCAIWAMVGACLGLSGMALARYYHETVSHLSILGVAVSLLHACLFFVHVSLNELGTSKPIDSGERPGVTVAAAPEASRVAPAAVVGYGGVRAESRRDPGRVGR